MSSNRSSSDGVKIGFISLQRRTCRWVRPTLALAFNFCTTVVSSTTARRSARRMKSARSQNSRRSARKKYSLSRNATHATQFFWRMAGNSIETVTRKTSATVLVLSYQAPSTIQKCEVEARLFSRFGGPANEHFAKPRFKFPPVYGPLSSQCVRANDTLALPSRRKYDGHRKETKSTRQPYRVNSRRKPTATVLLRKWVDVTGTQPI